MGAPMAGESRLKAFSKHENKARPRHSIMNTENETGGASPGGEKGKEP
jgi:hypothetical protein